MAKDGLLFIVPLLGVTLAALWLGWTQVVTLLILMAIFTGLFFRDPNRSIPDDPLSIVSPADGRVVTIDDDGYHKKISIFLSIFNVHVTRSPITGTISEVSYTKGRYRAAFNNKASVDNERNKLTIEGKDLLIECSQIAGLVARRIVCWKKEGDGLKKGERFGLIRFGSRVDLKLPSSAVLQVAKGDKVKAGSSIIAKISKVKEDGDGSTF